MNINACFSHNSDNWKTPTDLYNYFLHNDFIDLFPYCSSQDQYSKQYHNKKLYINPPFSHLRKQFFYNYLLDLLENENFIVLLMPVRTDTNLFNKLFPFINSIVFIKGRLHFNDSNNSSPFPTMLLILKKYKKRQDIYNFTLDELISCSFWWGFYL